MPPPAPQGKCNEIVWVPQYSRPPPKIHVLNVTGKSDTSLATNRDSVVSFSPHVYPNVARLITVGAGAAFVAEAAILSERQLDIWTMACRRRRVGRV